MGSLQDFKASGRGDCGKKKEGERKRGFKPTDKKAYLAGLTGSVNCFERKGFDRERQRGGGECKKRK